MLTKCRFICVISYLTILTLSLLLSSVEKLNNEYLQQVLRPENINNQLSMYVRDLY